MAVPTNNSLMNCCTLDKTVSYCCESVKKSCFISTDDNIASNKLYTIPNRPLPPEKIYLWILTTYLHTIYIYLLNYVKMCV